MIFGVRFSVTFAGFSLLSRVQFTVTGVELSMLLWVLLIPSTCTLNNRTRILFIAFLLLSNPVLSVCKVIFPILGLHLCLVFQVVFACVLFPGVSVLLPPLGLILLYLLLMRIVVLFLRFFLLFSHVV